MSERERRIWDAAYAAAFVAEFHETEQELQRAGGVRDPFDRAAAHSIAENAITVADLAVQRLHEWVRDECSYAGESIEEREP